MTTKKKLFFNTLLAATLSVGFLVACDSNNNNDGEKQALAAETVKQKEAAARAVELQTELDGLIADNEATRTELDKVAAEQAALQAELDARLASADARDKAWEMETSQREARIDSLNQQITILNARLVKINEEIKQAESDLAIAKTNLEAEQAQLVVTRQTIAREKQEHDAKVAQEKAALEALVSGKTDEINAAAEAAEQALATARAEAAKAVNEAGEEADRIKAKAHMDALAIEAEAKRAAADHAAAKLAEVEAEVQRRRGEYDTEEAAREAIIKEKELEIQAGLEAVLLEQNEVYAREQEALRREQAIAAELARIEAENAKLQRDKAALAAERELHERQVVATRALFTEKGLEDIWPNIERGKTFAFRVVMIGAGSVKNIQDARGRVTLFNETEGLKTDTDKRVVHPELFASKTDREDRQVERENPNAIVYKDLSRTEVVKDSYIVTGKVEEVFAFLQRTNKNFDTLAKQDGPEAANLMMEAYPIMEVQVNMQISLYGSSSMKPDNRRLSLIDKFDIKPGTATITDLNDVDLAKPSDYYLKGKDVDCSAEVSFSCLIGLKKAGILSQEIQPRIYDEERRRKVEGEKMQISEAIEKIMVQSRQKLKLQNILQQIETQGAGSVVIVPRKTAWYEFGKDDIVINTEFTDMDAVLAVFEEGDTAEEELKSLAGAQVLEKIEIKYAVKSIEKYNGVRDSLLLKYMDAHVIDGELSLSTTVGQPQSIEVELPIQAAENAESKFIDLSLEGFTGGLNVPTKPEKPSRFNTHQEQMDYEAALRSYEEQMELIEDDFKAKKKVEYISRSADLAGFYKTLLDELAKVED